MKIFRILASSILVLISATSFGEVTFSYTYNFKPAYLQKLYDGLVEAQNRDSDLQDLIASVPLFDGDVKLPLQAICFPRKPETDGKGCTVSALQDPQPIKGQLRVSIKKPVEMMILRAKLTEILTAVAANDPNKALGHLNFGNVLYNAADDTKGSSDYFCAPEGAASNKTWQCYLTVSERN